jgi:chromosome segregation ATPase
MTQFSDWVIVGAFTLGVGIAGSLTGQVSVGLLGSTTGAVIGAAVSGKLQDKRQRDTVSELEKLKKLVATQEELTKLNQQVAILQQRVEDLQKEEAALTPLKGQYQEKQAELEKINQNLTALKEQELENRIAVINQKQSDLSKLEKLQQQLEQFKIEKSGLEGQINALNSQVKSLESKKITFQNVESELRQLERETQHLQGIKTGLEGNNAHLQVEKQKLEEIIRRLKAEIPEIENSANPDLQSPRENIWNQLSDIELQLGEIKSIGDFFNRNQY